MSTPVPPPPPLSTGPMDPAPPRGGTGRKILIGCGIAALVVCAAFLALVLYIRSKPESVTDFAMSQIESHFAADVTDQDKRELKESYAAFRQALVEHRIAKEPLERMRASFATGPKNEVTHDQVRDMITLFRKSVGAPESPSPPGAATPAAGGPPTTPGS